ncbi:hypothetical protein [Raineyella sp.]|uniref:hypothetical protein n=1 Tax=Raineyella sp. TaxID=1911550 RepID=UPI002B2165D1|nr:hypothetical protein [Raineyella sp.]MEA5155781.1 hypothetical protein [Raineyella sp.]
MIPGLALTRIQLWALLVGMGRRTRTRRRWSVAVLVTIITAMTAGLSSVYSAGLAVALDRVGAADLVLVIISALAAFGALSAGTFGVSRSALGGRDDTLLLSLPLRPRTIVLAKLAAVALQNILLIVVAMVPSGVVCAQYVAVPGWFWPALVVGAILVALAVTALSMALALLFTVATPWRRGRSLANVTILVVTAALSLALVPGVRHIQDLLGSDPAALRAVLQSWAWPFMALRDLTLDGSVGAAAVLLLIGLVPFCLVAWLLSLVYVPLVVGRPDTAPTTSRVDLTALGVRTPFHALLRREAHRFFTSTVYVVNSGFGVIMLLVGAGWLIIAGGLPEPVRAMSAALDVPLPVLAAVVLALLPALTCTTAPSISLEGDRLWILRAAPVDPSVVLAAKAALNLLVVLPALVPLALVLAVLTGAGPVDGALLLLIAALVTVLVAELGLVTNLLWPVLDAPGDAIVVKQSVSVLVALLVGFAGSVLLSMVGLAAAPVIGSTGALLAMLVTVTTGAVALFAALRTWGIKAFTRLG